MSSCASSTGRDHPKPISTPNSTGSIRAASVNRTSNTDVAADAVANASESAAPTPPLATAPKAKRGTGNRGKGKQSSAAGSAAPSAACTAAGTAASAAPGASTSRRLVQPNEIWIPPVEILRGEDAGTVAGLDSELEEDEGLDAKADRTKSRSSDLGLIQTAGNYAAEYAGRRMYGKSTARMQKQIREDFKALKAGNISMELPTGMGEKSGFFFLVRFALLFSGSTSPRLSSFVTPTNRVSTFDEALSSHAAQDLSLRASSVLTKNYSLFSKFSHHPQNRHGSLLRQAGMDCLAGSWPCINDEGCKLKLAVPDRSPRPNRTTTHGGERVVADAHVHIRIPSPRHLHQLVPDVVGITQP
ncbi:hypothetical protein BCR44DRAFT_1329809 [Catenaria anguillulae PL171]|uniref:Uncharacterized protein n=1 Tax=Catenaria anguillulae PL171 TaxID=765915 RepID=A0A1Y2H6L0_9FUNG|nr:hypothetical protein BCR44DRAFT_1329809 [Catenaria anguillulae PL171]